MIFPRSALWVVLAIATFAVFSQSKEMESFTLASNSSKPSALALNRPADSSLAKPSFQDQDLVQVEYSRENSSEAPNMESFLCNEDTCPGLYPKDGKIEGKNILSMRPAGINSSGRIVGRCLLEKPEQNYPFVRESNGHTWIFKTPSSSGQGEFTDISDAGNAVGFYEKDSNEIGFLMNSQGKWVMDIGYPANPCSEASPYLHTQPNGINDANEIVGNFTCTASQTDSADAIFNGNGFYRAADGAFYRVQYEDAVRTVAGKISNEGVIVGYYVMGDNAWTPFSAKKEDVIKPIAPNKDLSLNAAPPSLQERQAD